MYRINFAELETALYLDGSPRMISKCRCEYQAGPSMSVFDLGEAPSMTRIVIIAISGKLATSRKRESISPKRGHAASFLPPISESNQAPNEFTVKAI